MRQKTWLANNFRSIPFVGGVLAAAVAMAVVITVVASGGGGPKGGGLPSIQSLQCGTGESLVVLQAGQSDGFNPNADSPPAAPSAGLTTRLPPPLAGFDATAVDRRLGHTFANLPGSITSAEVVVRLKPRTTSIHPASENDTVELTFTDAGGSLQAGGWVRYLGPGNATAGLAVSQWIPNFWQSGYTFTWMLSALPNPSGSPTDEISLLNSLGYLDIVVQDDTAVDFVTLSLCVPGTPTPTPTPTLSLVVGTGVAVRDTPTPTPPLVVGTGVAVSDTPIPSVPSSVTFDKDFVPTGLGSIGGHFLFTVTNNGPGPISNFQVIDTFPPNLIAFGSSGPPWSCVASPPPTVICTYNGTLSASGSVTLTVQPNLSPAPVPPWQNCATLTVPVPGSPDIVLTGCATVPEGPTPTVTSTPTPRPTSTPTPLAALCDLTIANSSDAGSPPANEGLINYTIRVDWVCPPGVTATTGVSVHVDGEIPLKPPAFNQQPYPFTPGNGPQVTYSDATGAVGCSGPPHPHVLPPGPITAPGFNTSRFGCNVGILPANGHAIIGVQLDIGLNQNLTSRAVVDIDNQVAESNEGNNQSQRTDNNCCP